MPSSTATSPTFKNRQKYQEWPLALAASDAFFRHSLHFDRAPDDDALIQSKVLVDLPDFVFVDEQTNDQWNFEIKRLVPQHVRQRYEYAKRRLSVLDGNVPGIFTCQIHVDAADSAALLPGHDFDALIDFVSQRARTGAFPDQYEPVPGYELTLVNRVGAHVEPWLWDYELEPGSARESATIQLLSDEFQRHLRSARRKFDNLSAARNVLVFETRGTLLDRSLHMLGPFADGPDLLARFYAAAAASGEWTRRDTIVIDPHVNVWRIDPTNPARSARTIMMGTIYSADTPYTPIGSLVRLWPGGCPFFSGIRRSEPALMQPSECSCSH